MYLKRLDLLGFKSFAHKVSIHFSGGMTAIVGPNGCGKTNILDAIRWVLGEQRVSLLRGGKMEEVIFNGTRDVKPLGMAEVTMSLINDRGILPTEYNEVQITRRVFRSGESEYLMNKVPCRLKDITELFYDTGVGAHSYSVIQQEMIEAVISDKAEERRLLFEEAAGITKYKQRKKAALRKLEATEHDFLRLNDIYSEVKSQVNSLKRQYRKAERYQKALNDVKNWELYLSFRRLRQIESEGAAHKSRLAEMNDRRLDHEATLDRISAQLEADRKQQVDLEHELTNVGSEVYQATEEAHAFEKEISVLTEKRTNARALIERNQHEIQSLQAREKVLDQQIAETEQDLNQIRQAMDDLSNQLKQAEDDQAEADRQLLEARRTREQEARKLTELESRLSSGRTEGEGLREQEEELSRLVSELDSELSEKSAERDQARARIERQKLSHDELLSRQTSLQKSAEEHSTRLELLLEKNAGLSLEMSNLTTSIEACEARRKLLEEMIVHYEGLESGVVAAMEARERFGDGLVGTVAEKFVPVKGLETAVEAALGEMAGFIICKDRTSAEAVVRYLRSEEKGRVGILVPDSGTINPVVKRPQMDMPEFEGWLDSYVATDPDLRPLMEAVLARTAVFKEDASPREILKQLPFGFQAVSTAGTVYSKNVIAGGSDDRFPLFRRREKVAEQQEMIDELSRKLSLVENERNRVTAEVAACRGESAQTAQELDSLLEELEAAKGQLSELEYQIRSLDSDIDRLDKEKRSGKQRHERIRSRQYTLGLDYDQLAATKEQLSLSVSEISKKLTEREEAAAATLECVSRLQVSAVETRSRIDQADGRRTHLQELRQEIGKTIEAKRNEVQTADQEIAASGDRISELEEFLKMAFDRRAQITARQSSLRSTQSDLLEQISAREKQLKEIRSRKEALSDQIHQVEIRLNTLQSETNAVAARIREEYEVDITAMEPVNPDESLSDQQAREHLQQQKEALKKFGAVNLLALEEYQAASDREKFLGEQLSDLTNAKADLQTTITKINHTARRLFEETFDRVSANFKKLFLELFSGGEADIFLVDPSDPLDSDIEIIARPGRKKLLSINQMSGGERALTAIALLFSLYLVKPSPFCILDEIDAPLDDANCRRFLKMIATFSDQTQFIIITHNKITMEATDNLYGVTMEQPGISKLVAVRFADVYQDTSTGAVRIDTGTGTADETDEPAAEIPEGVVQRMNPSVPSLDTDDDLT